MSMSLRDQLLQAGLISQKQANDAERQQQRRQQQSRQQPVAKSRPAVPAGQPAARPSQGSKAAHDQALNRRQHEKAQKKALQDQIKQLIEQNRLPQGENAEGYNFVDGNKIRRVAVNADMRGSLGRGEIVIVRHQGRYELVPAAVGARIREREEHAVIVCVAQESAPTDDAYQGYSVPDDLIW